MLVRPCGTNTKKITSGEIYQCSRRWKERFSLSDLSEGELAEVYVKWSEMAVGQATWRRQVKR